MKKSLGAKTIVYPTPVFVVGTYDSEGKPNVMTAAWGGICCSKPPCVMISLREATYTYGNIVERKAFTISITPEKYIKEADYFGIATGKKDDKFSVSGLTPVGSDVVDAPYVQEFPFIVKAPFEDPGIIIDPEYYTLEEFHLLYLKRLLLRPADKKYRTDL